MENMDKKQCGSCGDSVNGGCCCYMHRGCHGRHHLLRVILKILIVIIIFSCGYKLGQMTGFIRAEYGGQYGHQDFGGFGMMGDRGYYFSNNAPTTITPATPTTPAPAK